MVLELIQLENWKKLQSYGKITISKPVLFTSSIVWNYSKMNFFKFLLENFTLPWLAYEKQNTVRENNEQLRTELVSLVNELKITVVPSIPGTDKSSNSVPTSNSETNLPENTFADFSRYFGTILEKADKIVKANISQKNSNLDRLT